MTLALVGIHIVGTVQNHPEFVWSTFEHILNAPDAPYYYTNRKGEVAKQPYASDGTFLFMETGAAMAGNVECMKETAGKLVANKTDKDDLYCGARCSHSTRRWRLTRRAPTASVVTSNRAKRRTAFSPSS